MKWIVLGIGIIGVGGYVAWTWLVKNEAGHK